MEIKPPFKEPEQTSPGQAAEDLAPVLTRWLNKNGFYITEDTAAKLIDAALAWLRRRELP